MAALQVPEGHNHCTGFMWRPVTGAVPHGSIAGPVNQLLGQRGRYLLSKFTDDTRLGGVAESPEMCSPSAEII